MKIAVSGASGLIGSSLVPALRADGHEVLRLVRRPARTADEVAWDPVIGRVDTAALGGLDAAVNLSGAGVGDKRWSDTYKKEILLSRTLSTDTLARALASLDPLPRVMVSASAIGYYGDTGDRAVDETAPKGTGFLADVVEAWEAAADPAREAGIRVVHPRTGLVVSPDGGPWGRLLPIVRLGVGGRLGSGRQWWSFISMADEVAALRFLLDHDLAGPVNLTAPEPATNAEVTAVLGEVLGRPTALPVPAVALKAVLGEFSSEVLGSARVLPAKLLAAGFSFQYPDIASATRALTAPAA